MIQGIWLLTAMCAALIVLWWRSEWKNKKTEHRAELAAADAETKRQRILTLEQQVEWYRSRSNHPAFRNVK